MSNDNNSEYIYVVFEKIIDGDKVINSINNSIPIFTEKNKALSFIESHNNIIRQCPYSDNFLYCATVKKVIL